MPPLRTSRLNWARRTSWRWWDEWEDTALLTQISSHGRLRMSTLPLGHGGFAQYWIFTIERGRIFLFFWNLHARAGFGPSPTFQAGRFTTAPGPLLRTAFKRIIWIKIDLWPTLIYYRKIVIKHNCSFASLNYDILQCVGLLWTLTMTCMWWAHNFYSANHYRTHLYTIDLRCSPFFNNRAYVRPVDLLFYHVYNWFKRGL